MQNPNKGKTLANTTPLLKHKHFIVKGNIRHAPKSANEVGRALAAIVKAVGMKIAVGPIAYYCPDEGNRGITAVAIIETSHVSIHVWDEPEVPQFQFDLYSCSDFDPDDVLEIIDHHFGVVAGESITLDRDYSEPFIQQVSEK